MPCPRYFRAALLCWSIAVAAGRLAGAQPVTAPPLNGSFEEWEVRTPAPPGWSATENLFPVGWVVEERPGETGQVARVQNLPGLVASLGAHSLYLHGRLLSTATCLLGRRSMVRLSLYARGQGGTLTVRLRQYGNPDGRDLDGLGTPLQETTADDWQEFSALFMTGNAGYGRLELMGNGVQLDKIALTPLSAGGDALPASRFCLPRAGKAPAADGAFTPDEWAEALTLLGGFMDCSTGLAVRRQGDLYLAADEKALYVCVREPGFWGGLKNEIKQRDGPVYEDESVEIWLDPDPAAAEKARPLYQLIANPGGAIFDCRQVPGQFDTAWNCPGLQVGSKVENGWWTLELSLPWESVAVQVGQGFGLNVCRNLQWPAQHCNLTGRPYGDAAAFAQVTLDKTSPVVVAGWEGEAPVGRLRSFARVANRLTTAQRYTAGATLGEERRQAALDLLPGGQGEVVVSSGPQPFRSGEVSAEVKSGAGELLFHHRVRFSQADMLAADEPRRASAARYRWEFFPLQGKVNLRVWNYWGWTPEQFAQRCGRAEIEISRAGQTVCRQVVDRPALTPRAAHFTFPFAPPQDGEYLARALLFDRDGHCLDVTSDSFEKLPDPPWLGNSLGKERTVIPPFTPLVVKGQTVSCWGREYALLGSGLPGQIRSQERQVLAAPVALVLEDAQGAQRYQGTPGGLRFTEKAADRVSFEGQMSLPDLAVKTVGTMEYDGQIAYRLVLTPTRPREVKRLSLEIPLPGVKYFHSSGSGRLPHIYIMEKPARGYVDPAVPDWTPQSASAIPRDRAPAFYFPPGEGVIWSSVGIKQDNIRGTFLPYLWVGNARCGLGWLADNDRGWLHDDLAPLQELVRTGDSVILRLNLIATPTTLRGSRTIEFALIATPVRPRLTGRNAAWQIGPVQGFGSDMRDCTFGVGFQDPYLLRPWVQRLRGEGPARLYVDPIYQGAGAPDARYMLHEWEDDPLYEFPLESSRFLTRTYGPDPRNYRSHRVSLRPSRNDYLVWWMNRWIEEIGEDGLYLDDTFPMASANFQQPGGGYLRDDGSVQGGFCLSAMRDYLKRVAVLTQSHHTREPHIILHMTGAMVPGAFSFADLHLDGENDHLRTGKDFMDYWGFVRMEVFGAGA